MNEQIIDNYDRQDEDSRLAGAYGVLEEAHTRILIRQQLTATRSVIADVGAGTGHYAAWLAGMGHQVHFSDLVPKHTALFTERHGHHPNVLSIRTEDARKLSYDDNVADMVILNGPLYHLTDRKDRLDVLAEAARILKAGGRPLAFTISRFAGLQYALSSGDVFRDEYYNMVVGELRNGVRDNRHLENNTFSTAYFHLPHEIESEIAASHLSVESTVGVAGPGGNTPSLEEAIRDPEKKQRLLDIAVMMERHPLLSPKMMTVAVNYRS